MPADQPGSNQQALQLRAGWAWRLVQEEVEAQGGEVEEVVLHQAVEEEEEVGDWWQTEEEGEVLRQMGALQVLACWVPP